MAPPSADILNLSDLLFAVKLLAAFILPGTLLGVFDIRKGMSRDILLLPAGTGVLHFFIHILFYAPLPGCFYEFSCLSKNPGLLQNIRFATDLSFYLILSISAPSSPSVFSNRSYPRSMWESP